jgi:ubiquinol-cytochrome c reductase cytochrome b subunit
MVLSNLSSIPWVGSFVVDFIRGGKELGGSALIRLYSMHLGFSALIALLLFRHRRLKFAGRETEEGSPQRFKAALFAAAVVGILVACVTFIPGWFSDPLKEAANPMINPERVSPPWYFLFLEETLKFLARDYPSWSFVLTALVAVLIFFLPHIDRNPERSLLNRPLALGVGAAFLVVLVYFSLLGTANARYGEKIILPDKTLSAQEVRGAVVFAEKNCAYCHQVFGREGRREGPDMAVVRQRQRSPEWVQRFILNARVSQPGTTMPRYEIPLEDLEALSAYLLSLGSQGNKFVAVDRKPFLDYAPFLQFGGAGGEGGR